MAIRSKRRVSILAVLSDPEDRDCLSAIISHSNWELNFAETYEEARAALEASEPGAVVSECRLPGGFGWRDLLRLTDIIPNAPPVIVTDRLADERLWAQVLNEGGYDVLLKPFDRDEVFRIISQAWLAWKHRGEVPAGRKPTRVTVSGSARKACAGIRA